MVPLLDVNVSEAMGLLKSLTTVLFCVAFLVLTTECNPMADFGDTKAGILELCKGFENARSNKVLCLVCKGFDISCLVHTTTVAPTTTISTTPSTTTTSTTPSTTTTTAAAE